MLYKQIILIKYAYMLQPKQMALLFTGEPKQLQLLTAKREVHCVGFIRNFNINLI